MQGPRLRLVGRANEMAALEDELTRAVPDTRANGNKKEIGHG
jgi:hypothetical protein